MCNKPNIKKFSFGELTSNAGGKTSASGSMGILTIVVGSIGFLLGAIDHIWGTKNPNVMLQSIILIGIGSGLLGYRKSKDSKENKLNEKKDI